MSSYLHETVTSPRFPSAKAPLFRGFKRYQFSMVNHAFLFGKRWLSVTLQVLNSFH
jgi:hypothetical protein